jgi:hypothetical protein
MTQTNNTRLRHLYRARSLMLIETKLKLLVIILKKKFQLNFEIQTIHVMVIAKSRVLVRCSNNSRTKDSFTYCGYHQSVLHRSAITFSNACVIRRTRVRVVRYRRVNMRV